MGFDSTDGDLYQLRRKYYQNTHVFSGEVAWVRYEARDEATGRSKARVLLFNLVRGKEGTVRRVENKIFCYGALATQVNDRLVPGARALFISEVEQIRGEGGDWITMVFGRAFGVMPNAQRSGFSDLEALNLEVARAICNAEEE